MKKDKRGFTLVELLAVIAILAILVVIALPSIIEVFNESKVDAFETQAKSVLKAAEQRYILDQINSSPEQTGITYCDNSPKSLELTGTEEIKYKISFNNEGKVTYFGIWDSVNGILLNTGNIKSSDLVVNSAPNTANRSGCAS